MRQPNKEESDTEGFEGRADTFLAKSRELISGLGGGGRFLISPRVPLLPEFFFSPSLRPLFDGIDAAERERETSEECIAWESTKWRGRGKIQKLGDNDTQAQLRRMILAEVLD